MTKILKSVLLLPFKNRIIGFLTLFIILVLFFQYFELQSSGEKKDLSLGPITIHVNSVKICRRTSNNGDLASNADSSTTVPKLPGSSTQAKSQMVNKPIETPTVLTQFPDGRFHETVPVSYTQPRDPSAEILDGVFTAPEPARREAIRIGTVCLENMNAQKMAEPMVLETLVRTARQFDLLAVQGFLDTNLNAIKTWVKALNTNGSTFGYLAAYPPVFKRDKNYQAPYVAFIYNRRAVDADKNTLLVLEAGDRMACAPIAALFTARTTEKIPAFTFIALNVWIPPTNAQAELSILQQTFSMIRAHIQGEDDILVLGDFGTNINYVPDIARNPHLNWAFTCPMSNYRNQEMTANILFYDNSVTEFRNQSGLFNVEKLTGLCPIQIQTFMPNPPLWGKFNVTEIRGK